MSYYFLYIRSTSLICIAMDKSKSLFVHRQQNINDTIKAVRLSEKLQLTAALCNGI